MQVELDGSRETGERESSGVDHHVCQCSRLGFPGIRQSYFISGEACIGSIEITYGDGQLCVLINVPEATSKALWVSEKDVHESDSWSYGMVMHISRLNEPMHRDCTVPITGFSHIHVLSWQNENILHSRQRMVQGTTSPISR